jgi:hypothetical protein
MTQTGNKEKNNEGRNHGSSEIKEKLDLRLLSQLTMKLFNVLIVLEVGSHYVPCLTITKD